MQSDEPLVVPDLDGELWAVAVDDEGPDLAQVAVLGGLGLVAAGSVLVLAAGSVAGILFGSGVPAVRPSDASAVLLRLPGTAHDPRLAWPAEAQAALPGPTGFYLSYLSVVLLLAVAGVLFLTAVRAVALMRPGRTGATMQLRCRAGSVGRVVSRPSGSGSVRRLMPSRHVGTPTTCR